MYKYRFPAYGQIGNEDEALAYKELLEKNLTESPDCMGAWCMFPSENPNPLDHVSFDTDEKGNVSAVTLHTYTELWEGRENDLKSCLEENLKSTSQVYWMGGPDGVMLNGDMEVPEEEKQGSMTYHYRIPIKGSLAMQPKTALTDLEGHLKNSPDCMAAYCMFDSDSEILDHASIENLGDSLTAVNLYTYTQLWEGQENDLADCVQANLTETMNDVEVAGPVQFKGLKGEIPETLYHVTDRKNLESIQKNGLMPGTGDNSYKDMENHVYLASEKDLAPWIAVLPHMDDPMILKVDTSKVKGLEQGRVFADRDYVKDVYTEYRTRETIPASAITPMEHGRGTVEFDTGLGGRMFQMMENTVDTDETNEVKQGMERLENMGILNTGTAKEASEARMDQFADKTLKETMPEAIMAEEGLPWDENDNGRNPQLEDDFTKAIESLSGQQMTLADYGIR